MFSCKTRGFCPSCHAKRREEWGQWVREILLLDVPHRQVVFTIPKTLRIFFKYRRRLLGELSRAAEAERIGKYMVRPILALDRLSFLENEGRVGYRHGDDGAELERMDYLELIARVTSHIPDKGQVMVRYYGLYANARIHPSPGVDVRSREAASGLCPRASRPDGSPHGSHEDRKAAASACTHGDVLIGSRSAAEESGEYE